MLVYCILVKVYMYTNVYQKRHICIRFLSNLCKNDLNTVLGRNLFSLANDCSVNLSDLSKMSVVKVYMYTSVIVY